MDDASPASASSVPPASPSAAEKLSAAGDAATPCPPACDPALAGVTDEERGAARVLQTVLDLHLNLQNGDTSARATLLLQNGTARALPRLVLQVSSSLLWQSVRLLPKEGSTGSVLPLHQQRITTDADHTGSATELVVMLPQPLAPGATASLDLFYGGKLGTSTERLLRLGAPADRAALSDWDTVSDRFTGLRGFGNVLWMPAAAPVSLLGSESNFVAIADEQRLRNESSRMSLRLTVETNGPPPGAAFALGTRQPLVAIAAEVQTATGSSPSTPTAASGISASSDANAEADLDPAQNAGDPRLYTAQWPMSAVGAELPSLFLTAAPERGAALRVATDALAAADAYGQAADRLRPLLEEWLGTQPARPLDVLDMPLPGAQPFAADDLLVAPLSAEPGDAKELAPVLAYPLAAAWLPAHPVPWLGQGLPEFLRLQALERNGARDAALTSQASATVALADWQAEPSHVPVPLARCVDALCARTKGASVLIMLRQIAGDAPLKQALVGWIATRPAGAGAGNMDTVIFERLLQTASGKDLHWFFADWIDRDAGLPDLQIVNVAPRRIERGTVTNTVPSERRPVGGPIGAEPVPQPGDPAQQESESTASRNRIAPRDGSWLVAVEVQNNGDAVAGVPVTVRGSGLQNTLYLRIAGHRRATVRVPFEAAPEEVTVNDGTVPEQRSMTHHRGITLAENVR